MIPSHLVSEVTRRRAIDAAIDLAVGDINDPAAFTRLVTAVSVHLDAERQKRANATPAVPFGWQKGRSLTVLTLNQLQRLEQYVTGTIHNAKKAQFRDSNLTLRAAILAELHRRSKGT